MVQTMMVLSPEPEAMNLLSEEIAMQLTQSVCPRSSPITWQESRLHTLTEVSLELETR